MERCLHIDDRSRAEEPDILPGRNKLLVDVAIVVLRKLAFREWNVVAVKIWEQLRIVKGPEFRWVGH